MLVFLVKIHLVTNLEVYLAKVLVCVTFHKLLGTPHISLSELESLLYTLSDLRSFIVRELLGR